MLLSLSSLSSLCEKIEVSSFFGILVGGKGIVLFSARRPRFWHRMELVGMGKGRRKREQNKNLVRQPRTKQLLSNGCPAKAMLLVIAGFRLVCWVGKGYVRFAKDFSAEAYL